MTSILRAVCLTAASLLVASACNNSDREQALQVCGWPEATKPLETIPDDTFLFRNVDLPCSATETDVLLHNSSDETVHIDEIRSSNDAFVVSLLDNEALPRDLATGASLALHLRYVDTSSRAIQGSIEVNTPGGCMTFLVIGQPTSLAMIFPSAFALDFGAIDVGMVSEPKQLTALSLHKPNDKPFEIVALSASPASAFVITDSPALPASPETCDTLSVRLAFTAPPDPGPVKGKLTVIGVHDGRQFDLDLPLFGTAVTR